MSTRKELALLYVFLLVFIIGTCISLLMLLTILNFDFCQNMTWTKSSPCPLQWKEIDMCNIHPSIPWFFIISQSGQRRDVLSPALSRTLFSCVDNFKSDELVPAAGAWCFSWKCHLRVGEMSVPFSCAQAGIQDRSRLLLYWTELPAKPCCSQGLGCLCDSTWHTPVSFTR